MDERINPETRAEIERDMRERASWPYPPSRIEGRARDVAHIEAARRGMVPVLADEETFFVPLDQLTPELLPGYIDWHEAEARRHSAAADRAQFTRDVLGDLEGL